jgi:death-on-curing family protein
LIAWPKTIEGRALADANEIAYVSLNEAATLIWGIAENQAFPDGNKRLALVVTLTFLEVNGFRLEMSDDEKVQLMFDMSSGTTVPQVAELIRQRLRPLT